jgi:muramidase (phage lysozyme)
MALSQVYLEWEKQTKRLGVAEGLEQGLEQERRSTIENLIQLRFGTIDQDLQMIIPKWMSLNSAEYTSLLLQLAQLSKEELIQYFQR